ncbi:MAG: hypothetical protein ABF917_13790, partial [Gluconobacter oxydans]|uniref:hypothetical protein n=1 Tax=Gluconobacter oxydans TaxID=442 RepID=UPI0039E93663
VLNGIIYHLSAHKTGRKPSLTCPCRKRIKRLFSAHVSTDFCVGMGDDAGTEQTTVQPAVKLWNLWV